MTSILTKLPSLGFRPARGLSSRLGCHVRGRRGTDAVVQPWATRQQMRFLSNDTELKYNNPKHYETLGVKPSATPHETNVAWAKKWKKLHSDSTGSENKRATKELIELQDAGDILRFPERRAKYDAQHGFNRPAQPSPAKRQPSAAEKQREADARGSALLRRAAQLRAAAERSRAARAAAEAEAAQAKKRDEARRAQEKKKKADEEDPAIRAARVAARAAARERDKAEREKEQAEREEAASRAAREAQKKAEEEAAERRAAMAAKQKAEKEAAERSKAIARARIAELASQREGGKRLVVLRHVPDDAKPLHLTQSLALFKAGRILDMGYERGTAWVEFFIAEQAKALYRLVNETDRFTICGTTISTAEIRQGTVTPPQGPELITRCLRIAMPAEFLNFSAHGETLNGFMVRKLRERGFWTRCVGYSWESTVDGVWLTRHHFSVTDARSAKAAIEKYYPQLGVAYVEDECGGLPQTPSEDTLKASGIDKKEPEAGEAGHWAPRPVEVAVAAVFAAIATWMELGKDKSSDDKKQ